MTAHKTSTLVNIGVTLKAQLEILAEQHGMQYREYLAHLADTAVDSAAGSPAKEPTRQTRIHLSDSTKSRVKQLSRLASCSQEQWLLQVFQTAVQEGGCGNA